MNNKHLFGVLITFMVVVIISIVIRSCIKHKYNIYNDCNQEESYGVDVDLQDVDIDIYIKERANGFNYDSERSRCNKERSKKVE